MMARSSPPNASWTCLRDRKSTRLNSSHGYISYAVFCLKKKKTKHVIDVDAWQLGLQSVVDHYAFHLAHLQFALCVAALVVDGVQLNIRAHWLPTRPVHLALSRLALSA